MAERDQKLKERDEKLEALLEKHKVEMAELNKKLKARDKAITQLISKFNSERAKRDNQEEEHEREKGTWTARINSLEKTIAEQNQHNSNLMVNFNLLNKVRLGALAENFYQKLLAAYKVDSNMEGSRLPSIESLQEQRRQKLIGQMTTQTTTTKYLPRSLLATI
eukprot:GEZU01027413.1.p1 GENE.GEZU01027413.1~~GEZU01027413.1.p1  ORF type:complete len:164 (+),score=41.50 GEZU01027413.1:677-1168(+)